MIFKREKTTLQVQLSPEQYKRTELAHYEKALAKQANFFQGEVANADEENVTLLYHLPEHAKSIATKAKSATHLERLAMARKCSALTDWEKNELVVYIHPDNLFFVSGHLQIAHRGLRNIVFPKQGNFFKEYQALIISILVPKYDYDSLMQGEVHLRDALSQEIMEATSPEEIEAIIDKQYVAFDHVRQTSERVVHKGRFRFLSWTAGLSLLLAIGLSIGLGFFALDFLPQRERVIDSKTAFLTNNFHEAVTSLTVDTPASLPRSAQFVLAASFVQLENLTNDQQTAILNHLSVNSSEQELLYWIYIGRGQLENALSMAQILGDNQLILHAYIRLYDATYTNITLPGQERLEQLDYYRERMEEINQLLIEGADADDYGAF